MNKIIKLTLTAFTAVSLSACSKLEQGNNRDVLKNAFQMCDTLEEAMKISGINEIVFPASIEGYSEPEFSANENGVIQVEYYDDEGEAITLRKAEVEDEDLSEDYTDYDWTTSYTFANPAADDDQDQEVVVTLQGKDEDTFSKATWSYAGYSYSIVASNGYADMSTLVKQSSALAVANPYIDCETLEEAEELAGFEMTLPESIDDYEEPTFQAVKGSMIQVNYCKEGVNDPGNAITIRKSNVEDKDISGDYNDYTWETTYSLMNSEWEGYEDEECTVTLKGDSAETPYHATWSHGGYSYSIVSNNGYSNIPTLITDVE